MKLYINDEFAPLKHVVVGSADHVPAHVSYKPDDIQFTNFHPLPWDLETLKKQHDAFCQLLSSFDITITTPDSSSTLPQQIYTRDTAFVVGSQLYYSGIRRFADRIGEISPLLTALSLEDQQIVKLENPIEGGDVLVLDEDTVFVAQSSRTSKEAIQELSQHIHVEKLLLGPSVMHLDTRLTLLPKNLALIYPHVFSKTDLHTLSTRFTLIEVEKDDEMNLGANVFFINPETVIVPSEYPNIAKALGDHGFDVRSIPYSEVMRFGGSFHCTTMPIERKY